MGIQLSPHPVDRRQRVSSSASECKPNSLPIKNNNDAMRDQRTQSAINNRPPAIVQRRAKLPSATDGLPCVKSVELCRLWDATVTDVPPALPQRNVRHSESVTSPNGLGVEWLQHIKLTPFIGMLLLIL